MNEQEKIVDYTICESFDVRELSIKVWKMIQQGWQPWGGLTVCGKHGWQAMVKVERTPDQQAQPEEK